MVFVKAVCPAEAHDLPMRIDRLRKVARITGHTPEIDYGSVFPENRADTDSGIGKADSLAGIVYPVCL